MSIMQKNIVQTFSIIILLILSAFLRADVINVPGHYSAIQEAIVAADDYDVIIAAVGDYHENIDFLGKPITVRSADPSNWATVTATVIDGDFNGSCVKFVSGEGPDSILEGFTLTRGEGTYKTYDYRSGDYGGGVYCIDSSPVIRRCNITGNGYSEEYDTFYTRFGGGIALLGDSRAMISNCMIIDNGVSYYGAGIYIYNTNSAGAGGVIINCTIADNVFDGWDNELHYQIDSLKTKVTITNTIIWGYDRSLLFTHPDLITFSNIRDAYFSETQRDVGDDPYDLTQAGNNICESPGFEGDGYHLKNNSVCINAGDPDYDATGVTDIDGEPRLMGQRIDIGADEYSPELIVIAPTGGELWVSGSIHNIQWETIGVTGVIDIYYSINAGVDWLDVVTETDDDGSYQWTVPVEIDSAECMVKVLLHNGPDYVQYTQSGEFTVHPVTIGVPVDSDWPSLGGDYNRSGRSQHPGPLTGCEKWQFAVGGAVYSSVALGADGNVHIACEDGKLYTINSAGVQQWDFEAGSPLTSSPSVGTDGAVYVGAQSGVLYALDKSGQLRWRALENHDVPAGMLYSTPAISSNGNVYVGDQDGYFYCFGPDGSELWKYFLGLTGRIPVSVLASPAIGVDGNVYVGSMYNSKLVALAQQDGVVQWTHTFDGGSIFVSPVVAGDGAIYVNLLNDTNLYALNPSDGSEKWRIDLGDGDLELYGADYAEKYSHSCCWSEPAIAADGTIYISFDDPFLRAVDPAGTIKWVTRLGQVGGFTLTVADNGLIYAASDDGAVYVVDQNGNQISRFDSDDFLAWPVVGPDGTLYASDAGGVVRALALNNCTDKMDLHYVADVNADGNVNLEDFAALGIGWMTCYDPENIDCNEIDDEISYLLEDVNRDFYINLDDLVMMSDQWLNSVE